MDSGQWTVDSGQWTVDSGQWTENCIFTTRRHLIATVIVPTSVRCRHGSPSLVNQSHVWVGPGARGKEQGARRPGCKEARRQGGKEARSKEVRINEQGARSKEQHEDITYHEIETLLVELGEVPGNDVQSQSLSPVSCPCVPVCVPLPGHGMQGHMLVLQAEALPLDAHPGHPGLGDVEGPHPHRLPAEGGGGSKTRVHTLS